MSMQSMYERQPQWVSEMNSGFGTPDQSSAYYSPASSSSTLTLDDDEVRFMFESIKMDDDYALSLRPDPVFHDSLNPNAAPFIPRNGTTTSLPTLMTQLPSPARLPPPVWLDFLSLGARTSALQQHDYYAAAVVTSRDAWSFEFMAELAEHFRWRGGEKWDDESGGIALFAKAVHRHFGLRFGEEIQLSFLWHLREVTIGAFKSAWDPSTATGITFLNAPSLAYVTSATALAAFVGQLFQLNLISGPQTGACVYMILEGVTSYEHLMAMYVLLFNAGPVFWHPETVSSAAANVAIHTFVANILQVAVPLRDSASVLGNPLHPGAMREIIVKLENLLTGWATEHRRQIL